MNKSMLERLKWQIVRLRPNPRQLTKETLALPSDDLEFLVQEASHESLSLYDPSGHITLRLKPDQIRQYLSEGERGGYKRGFLQLKVQWFLRDRDAWVEPLFV